MIASGPEVSAISRKRPAISSRASSQVRSEEHTSELQSRQYLVCRLLLEKKKITNDIYFAHVRKELPKQVLDAEPPGRGRIQATEPVALNSQVDDTDRQTPESEYAAVPRH